MFDVDEFIEEIIITVGIGLIGYNRITNLNLSNYELPTKEEVIDTYQNNPLFNRTVDTITSYILRLVEKEIDSAWRRGHTNGLRDMTAQINRRRI